MVALDSTFTRFHKHVKIKTRLRQEPLHLQAATRRGKAQRKLKDVVLALLQQLTELFQQLKEILSTVCGPRRLESPVSLSRRLSQMEPRLTRFITRDAGKSLPFTKMLRHLKELQRTSKNFKGLQNVFSFYLKRALRLQLLVQVINDEVQNITRGTAPVVASNSHLGFKNRRFWICACIEVKLVGLEELKSHEFREFQAAYRTSVSMSSGSSGDWTSLYSFI